MEKGSDRQNWRKLVRSAWTGRTGGDWKDDGMSLVEYGVEWFRVFQTYGSLNIL